MCTVTIIVNTAFIGYTVNEDMKYALDNVGMGPPEQTVFRATAEILFFIAYSIEYSLRFALFGVSAIQ